MCRWSYGSNKLQIKVDTSALQSLRRLLNADKPSTSSALSASVQQAGTSRCRPASHCFLSHHLAAEANEQLQLKSLLLLLLDNELRRLEVWDQPLADSSSSTVATPDILVSRLHDALHLT